MASNEVSQALALRNGSAGEDLLPISPQNGNRHICYGALCNAKARVSFDKSAKPAPSQWKRFCELTLAPRGNYFSLVYEGNTSSTSDSQGVANEGTNHNSDVPQSIEVGMLDLITTRYLKLLEKYPDCKATAVILTAHLRSNNGKKSAKNKDVDTSVNILGPERILNEVGAIFAKGGAYLQHPYYLQHGISYINPQYYYPNNQKIDLNHLIGPLVKDAKATRVSNGIRDLLEDNHTFDHRVISEYYPNLPLGFSIQDLIVTPLKKHQENGLEFIMSQEDPAAFNSIFSDLRNLMGPELFPNNSELCLGGIIADVMGLGKTLMMLSAIAVSKNMLRGSLNNNEVPVYAEATLVVVTSRQVLDVWLSEMERHLKRDTLKVAVFHGDSRTKTVDGLRGYDVVLTTYHTLVSDYKRSKVLQQITWLRVVLDEAHWIRNQSSEQFKASQSLQSDRRWCLTGTPIQNSLDDLQSLLKFLHFEPFSRRAFFDRHVIDPLRREGQESFRNLRLLLRSICLRRNANSLNLPSVHHEQVSVVLSPEERVSYHRILTDCEAAFDRLVSTKSEIKKYNCLFTAVMKLRRLCNHGTWQLPSTSHHRSSNVEPKSKRRKLDLNEVSICEFCTNQDDDNLMLLKELETCPECSRNLGSQETNYPDSLADNLSLEFSTSSSPLSNSALLMPTPDSRSPTPLTPIENPLGYSSKLLEVLSNIKEHIDDSKSLVFTSWRSTLDILEIMLSEAKIPFLRIDGRVRSTDREAILTRFREDPQIPALLMSIETGAVGLTLTVANRVHIVEPQWNPSIEEQAIGRALRMGQTREVTVIRYITEKTLEQNILSNQKRKTSLAKFSLDSDTDTNATGKLDDLKFILDA